MGGQIQAMGSASAFPGKHIRAAYQIPAGGLTRCPHLAVGRQNEEDMGLLGRHCSKEVFRRMKNLFEHES